MERIMAKQNKIPNHPRALKHDPNHNAPIPWYGDECYGGYFKINVTALADYITEHPAEFELAITPLTIWPVKDLLEGNILLADISRPVIVAEIAPDRLELYPGWSETGWERRGYVMIDGFHRTEKARRQGKTVLPAYIVRMEQHIGFLYEHFDAYVDYWNGKLTEYMRKV
jgi:hypothetical protein